MRALRLSETRRESETRNTSFALKPGTGLAFATLTWWRHGMPPQRSRPVALPDGPAVPNGRAATSTGRDAHKRQQDTRRAQPVRPRSRFGVVNKVHPLVADSRATSRSRANGSAKWPRRLSSMRPSVTRFTGPMRGTTATALDPLRRMSVQRISLSSSGSLTGAWYKDDDVQAQPTGKWCARHPAQPAGQSARRAADTSRAINKPQLHCCMRSALWRRYILHPTSAGRFLWDYALRFLVFASLVVVPLRLAFVHTEEPESWLAVILYADVALDLLCVIDVALNFSFGYITVNAETARREVVSDGRRIAKRYLRHSCVLEMLSIGIPFQASGQRTIEMQLLSLFKILRVQRWFRVRARERHRAHEVGRMPRPVVVEKLSNIIKLLIFFLAWAHLTGCFCEYVGSNLTKRVEHSHSTDLCAALRVSVQTAFLAECKSLTCSMTKPTCRGSPS